MNLTNQVRSIAEVTKAVASGYLTKRITVDVRGEMLDLKKTVNGMTESLSVFADEVTRVAKEVGTEHITAVAIAYVMQKMPYVFPIIGGRKVEHLNENLEALEISLTPEQIKTLDNIVPFDKGFPYAFFVSYHLSDSTA